MSTYTIELTQETSDALTQAAADRSASVEDLIACATEHFLAEQSAEYEWSAEDVAAIEEGIAQLDRGEGVPHEKVMAAMRAKHGG